MLSSQAEATAKTTAMASIEKDVADGALLAASRGSPQI